MHPLQTTWTPVVDFLQCIVVVETRDEEHALKMIQVRIRTLQHDSPGRSFEILLFIVQVLRDKYTQLTVTGCEGALGIFLDEENENVVSDLYVPTTGLGVPYDKNKRRLSICTIGGNQH